MFTSIELLTRVGDYLERRITLRDLESWLVPRLPLYLQNPSSNIAEIVGTIELCLSELNAGIRTERGVRQVLARRFANEPIVIGISLGQDSQNEATTSSPMPEVVNFDWRDPLPSWSTEVQVGSV